MDIKKTWSAANFASLHGSGNDATDVKLLFVQIKNAIVGFGHPVKASCNGTIVSDGDVIVGPRDVVTPPKEGPGPRTWVVIRLSAFVELCVEFADYQYNRASFYVGGSFTGGDLNSRPRAEDEVIINRTPWWVTARGASGGAYGASVLAAEGSLRVIVGSHKQDAEVVWLFERVGAATFCSVFSGPLSAGDVLFDDPSTSAPGYVLHEVADGRVLASCTTVNEISGEHMLFPVGIFSLGQKIGYIDDLWATPTPPAKNRDELDGCVVMHGNVYPWGGPVEP